MHQLLTSAVERKQSEVWKLSRALNPKARMTRLQTHHLARKYNLPRRQPYSLFWTSAGVIMLSGGIALANARAIDGMS
jgi:hypothetical protein